MGRLHVQVSAHVCATVVDLCLDSIASVVAGACAHANPTRSGSLYWLFLDLRALPVLRYKPPVAPAVFLYAEVRGATWSFLCWSWRWGEHARRGLCTRGRT